MSQKFSDYLKKKQQAKQPNQDTSTDQLDKKKSTTPKTTTPNNTENPKVTDKGDESTKTSDYSWSDLDTIIKTYNATSSLPPMLSPDIPKIYTSTINERLADEEITIPQLLSPTLPKIYETPSTKKVPSNLSLDSTNIESDREKKSTSPESKSSNFYPEERQNSRSFEKVEHYGVHSYRVVKTPHKRQLFLTLHVPQHYKNNNNSKKEDLVGLGIQTSRKQPCSRENKKRTASDSSASSPQEVMAPSNKVKSANINEAFIKDATKLKEKYLQSAIDKKHRGDGFLEKNIKMALAHFLDCIILYLVGFSYEDQIRRTSRKLYNDAPWLSLVSFIDHVLKLSQENDFDDIAGLCLQIRTIVYEHISKIVAEFIQLDQAKRKRLSSPADIIEVDERLIKNTRDLLKYRDLSRKGLVLSEKYLSVFKLQSKYPKIVEGFQKQTPRHTSPGEKDATSLALNPMNDDIQLPITHGVNIREITAYGLKVVMTWSKNENVKYDKWNF